jgi:ABC-type multidrug transport system fused ATPase/permease subunit
LEAGKKYALAGTSGCGKSTLINLLCNFYQAQSGHIYLGNIEIKDYDLHELRSKIALVTQDNQLFHDTIWDNIKYGNFESSDLEIEEASQLTGVSDQLNKIKDGYQAIIGDRGAKLSGGQKQRIAIARAIIKKADIIILDEATSALDSESEKIIFENLCRLYSDKTMILISHRLSAIKDVDEIICMDKGKVVENGKHEELINKRGFYWALFKEQIE